MKRIDWLVILFIILASVFTLKDPAMTDRIRLSDSIIMINCCGKAKYLRGGSMTLITVSATRFLFFPTICPG